MLKSLLQRLLGLTGYVLVYKRRFGWELWQDIRTLTSSRADPVIIDAGAHRGETLLTAKRAFPGATLHCFEPDPDSFGELSRRAAQFGGVHLYQMGLGDVAGSFALFRNAASMTNSLLATVPAADQSDVADQMVTREKLPVNVITLDQFCAEQRIQHIDLLKIDCQGFDLRVLKGAQRMLSESQVSVILCEAIFDSQYADQGWFHEILNFLTSAKYALCGIYHPARNSRFEMTFADALFKLRPREKGVS